MSALEIPVVSEADVPPDLEIEGASDNSYQEPAPVDESIPREAPAWVRSTKHHDGRLFVAGEGPRPADIMFITPALLEEEAVDAMKTRYGRPIRSKPRYMKGPAGGIFKDAASSVGINVDESFYVGMCKWLLPRAVRQKPKKEHMAMARESLMNDIREVQPKIIVCLGKAVFDELTGMKIPLSDIAGGWFNSPQLGHEVRLYPMDDVTKLVSKPELVERFKVDLREVKRMHDQISGIEVPEVPRNYQVIKNKKELEELVDYWIANQCNVLSVDGEWHGRNHIDGKLRSFQFCWADGEAAYIRFMDDKLNYVFDCSYKEAGAILARHCNRKEVKYIGHHFAADSPWMWHVLGLEWFNKCIFDTEFGQQTADEFEGLGLERVSMKYTDLGRYDLDLTLWKRDNRKLVEDGYGLIPDDLLIPYACKDVDCVFRAWPQIVHQLESQGLLDYFNNTFLPFVTNIFTIFALNGLPMNRERMDMLRDVFHYARRELDLEFRKAIETEAGMALLLTMCEKDSEQGVANYLLVKELVKNGEHEKAFDLFKRTVGIDKLKEKQCVFDHYIISPNFNIRSPDQMRQWLFQVKGYTPVKSTNNKAKGLPSIPWDKVTTYPPERQAEFTPSTDKQTLEILNAQTGDAVLEQLLQLNAVGNLCKAFLKEADVDEDGELVKENGLHYWLASDGYVHGQMSTTETGRPRSWNPNSLNWPSWVNKKIEAGIKRILLQRKDEGVLPERFNRFLTELPPSIRSCTEVAEGRCLVESDYQTAEIRGLAFISGDDALIKIILEPDENFAVVKVGEDTKPVRIAWAGTGIDPKHQNPVILMSLPQPAKDEEELIKDETIVPGEFARTGGSLVEQLDILNRKVSANQTWILNNDNKFQRFDRVTDADLVRKDDGSLKHPKADLHWSLAEMVHCKPREILNEKKDRGAAKVGNFSSAYGASPNTLERKIESDTGTKPPEGQGQAILDALALRQPQATAFLIEMETIPKDPGYYRAQSGRIRHFYLHPDRISGLTSRMRDGQLSAMGRECRNFPMQESVAATAARAGNWLLDFKFEHGLDGSPMVILYDSVVTNCPNHERFIWKKAHTLFMFLRNGWRYYDRVLRYPIDTDFNRAWSCKPTKEQKKQYYDPEWEPTPEHLKPLEEWLDLQIQIFELDESLSVMAEAA